jgi:3-methyl-2-oxobutanoate hydroxymethyltransferase
MAHKITVPELRARKTNGPKIAMVTAYDATMAKLLEAGGADVLLVGDSLGMVVQGLSNTLPVTLDEMCYHGRAVARAAVVTHLVGGQAAERRRLRIREARGRP